MVSSTKAINKASNIKLSRTWYTYNGKVQTPSVTVKDRKGNTLKKGTHYTLSYQSGRKSVGRYYIKVNFKGNYSGSKTLYYDIVPKSLSAKKNYYVRVRTYKTIKFGGKNHYLYSTWSGSKKIKTK